MKASAQLAAKKMPSPVRNNDEVAPYGFFLFLAAMFAMLER
jgi:hypothetical protein